MLSLTDRAQLEKKVPEGTPQLTHVPVQGYWYFYGQKKFCSVKNFLLRQNRRDSHVETRGCVR